MRRIILGIALCAANIGCSSGGDLTTDSLPLPGLSSDYDSQMADRAEMLGISDPPEVSPVRVVTREEFLQVQQKCLAEEGFTTELDPDGDGLAVTLADGQGEAYFLADYVCQGRYPLHEVYTRDVTEAQLRTYFEWNTGELATCMAGLGYAVPDPPSFEVFTAAYGAGRGMWMPFDDVPDELWMDTVTDVDEHCQVEPSDEAIFGAVG